MQPLPENIAKSEKAELEGLTGSCEGIGSGELDPRQAFRLGVRALPTLTLARLCSQAPRSQTFHLYRIAATSLTS